MARLGRLERVATREVTLDKHAGRFATSFGDIEAPIQRIHSIELLPGGQRVLDAFDDGPINARVTGSAQLDDSRSVSAPNSLRLSQPKGLAEWQIEPTIASGTFRMRYFDNGAVQVGRTWTIRFDFAEANDASITLTPGWADSVVRAEAGAALPGTTYSAPRKTDWRLVEVSYGDIGIFVTIDGITVVSALELPVARRLERVTVAIAAPANDARQEELDSAAVWIDDVSLADSRSATTRWIVDPTQFDVLAHNGDQWFGTGLSANQKAIRLRSSSESELSLPWSSLQSIRFPARTFEPLIWTGEVGRLQTLDGTSIMASLLSADDAQWRIAHPVLGERSVPLEQVAVWRPQVLGRHSQVFDGALHLGSKIVDSFENPLTDGTRLLVDADIANPTRGAVMTVSQQGMEGMGEDSPFSKVLESGGLRTELWVNGAKVDYLNRLLEGRPTGPREILVSLKPAWLKAGINSIELRQTPDPATSGYDEVEIHAITIDEPDLNEGRDASP
jgi:hypothetical protein